MQPVLSLPWKWPGLRFITVRGASVSILDLFCSVDEFWQRFAPAWHRELLASGRRYRSPRKFLLNLLAGLIAYCHQPKKPSLDLGLLPLPAA
jgi:hypothetical protein